ncbi:hypothetical protein ACHAQJ_009875 [Trichoderma viride]
MAPQDKKWDDSAERDLCVALILGNQETGKSRLNWPRTAEIMDGLGYSFTKDAMSQHFTKTIMKEFNARHNSTATTDSPPLSARKPKAAGKKAATTPSKKRTKKSAQDTPKTKGQLPDMGDDKDDDFDYDTTPCKKVKKEEKSTVLKKEEDTTTKTATVDNEEAFLAWAAKGASI